MADLKGLGPEYGPLRPGGAGRSWVNIEKARRVLGFEPKVGLRKGLRELIELWRAERLATLVERRC